MSKNSNTQNTNSTGNVTYTYTSNTRVENNYSTSSTQAAEFDYEEQKQLFQEHMKEKLSRDVVTSTVYDKFLEVTTTYSLTDLEYLNSLREKLWKPSDLTNVELTLKELDELEPNLEVVESDKGKTEWNDMRKMVSTASYSKGVGRGVKFYMKDKKSGKVLGVAELSSDFGNLGVRDTFLGWSKENRFKQKKLKNTAVCSTVVATQPFGHNFLGGKLLCLLLTSDYVRKVWKDKYGDELVGLTTTSLKGHKNTPSMYCGLGKYWKSLGHTTGKVLMTPDSNVYKEMTQLLKENFKEEYDKAMSKSGPKQQVLSLLLKKLGLKKKDFYHGFERGVYFSSFYNETKEFLKNENPSSLSDKLVTDNNSLVELWRVKAKKRYLKLVDTERLNYNDLFYSNLVGCSWEDTQVLYLVKELTQETPVVNGKPSNSMFSSFSYSFSSDLKPQFVSFFNQYHYVEVDIKTNINCLNQSTQLRGMLSSQYFTSFMRAS